MNIPIKKWRAWDDANMFERTNGYKSIEKRYKLTIYGRDNNKFEEEVSSVYVSYPNEIIVKEVELA